MSYKEVKGDLIELTLKGEFDVIAHGVNCQCVQGAGLAPQMVKVFGTDSFHLEHNDYKGDINKLGQIDYQKRYAGHKSFQVVNAYTQYKYGRNHTDGVQTPIDYEALTLCMRKINHRFAGKHIGLPKIGAGLAGGDWERIKSIIQNELTDCSVTVVIFEK